MVSKKGFTLIEILTVIAIMAVLATVSVIFLYNRRSTVDLTDTSSQMAALLREAQSRSEAGNGGASWGVHFANATNTAPFYALFSGSYATGTVAGYYRLPASVSYRTSTLASGATLDVSFAQISGVPSTAATIGLSSPNSTQSATTTTNGYTYGRTVTIDHTQVQNTDQTNFPVLISGTYSYLATTGHGGNVTNANGYDLIFTSDASATTKLSFEQESYSSSTGAINYWVKVPTVSHTADTIIYIFYDNASTTTDQSNKTAVWDSNYTGVWHLDQDPTGASPQFSDSTSHGNNGTADNSSSTWISTQQTAGQIGGSLNFDVTNGLDVTYPEMVASNNMTISAWIKPLETTSLDGGYALIFGHGPAGSDLYPCGEGLWWYQSTKKIDLYGGPDHFNNTALTEGDWYYVTAAVDGGNLTLYLDGVPDGTSTYSTNGEVFNSLGADTCGGDFKGQIDEVRYTSGLARSGDWVATEYDNQSSPSSFYNVGPAITIQPTGAGYINVYSSGEISS